MELNNLISQTGEWLKAEGNSNDIVISSRIRLARNIENFKFITQVKEKEFEEIEIYIKERINKLDKIKDFFYLRLDQISKTEVFLLFERHLISQEHANSDRIRAVSFNREENISIMINEEDHLRIQRIKSGFELEYLWKEIDKLDDKLSEVLPFAFNTNFGYLTACPTNVGTGLRASVMLHLPMLSLTKNLDKIFKEATKFQLAIRGFYGEGTEALGDFFQLSNQITLGKSEENIIKQICHVVPFIVNFERQIRKKILEKDPNFVKNLINESYKSLLESESLTSSQMMNHLSIMRMGIHIGKIDNLSINDINKMFILSQPYHICKKEGKEIKAEERDKKRAYFCKEYLEQL